ncbi:hypothetical protein PTE30175_00003 [Pandoraea terrae]|uniref:Uncharacterized protein n=1 Tax=Pandoraea terrae TaxID=1537710 RepID=A0A5E4R7B8_9BURK|nr:hypothetical protein PTE30175_00003 [Pandoraea terrae]
MRHMQRKGRLRGAIGPSAGKQKARIARADGLGVGTNWIGG